MSAGTEAPTHSRAFERLVGNEGDVLGLVAYGLYKQSIRQAAVAGAVVHSSSNRDPTPTEVDAYRTTANNLLAAYAVSVVEQSRASIIDTAVRADIARIESSLTRTIERATAWRAAITSNLVAWLLSIAITFLIVVSGVPGWMGALIARLTGG